MDLCPRQAAKAAYFAAALNLAGALAMLLSLRPGLPVEGSRLADRQAFLAGHLSEWWAAWLLWHAAAIALLGFYVGLAALWRRRAPILCGLALLCSAAGLAADISAESLLMGLLPGLGADAFASLERAAGLLTGYVGNGLYTVAGLLLTCAGAGELPRGLIALAGIVWACGFWLSAATLADSAAGQFWSTAFLMPSFVFWAVLMGRWLQGRA